MEPGNSMPNAQGISNNPYSEPNRSKFLKLTRFHYQFNILFPSKPESPEEASYMYVRPP
jgi:hypothetical protein